MRLSIIIPTFNRASLLPRAIASIARSVIDIEIIIVDDASFDGTDKVLEVLSKHDARISCIRLSRNGGVNAARNAGIERATGEWITFLDSDDEYAPGGLESLLASLLSVSSEIGVVGCMTMRDVGGDMKPRGFRVGEDWDVYKPSYRDIVFKEHVAGDINYSIRRSVFERGYWFAEYVNGFESAFYAKLAKDGERFLYVNKIVDLRHSGFDVHLSAKPYERWPRQFARAYGAFLKEHNKIICERPLVARGLYRRIGSCLLRAGDVSGLWWLMKVLLFRI